MQVKFTVPGKTISKANSYRIAKKRMYKTQACKDWENRITFEAGAAMLEINMEATDKQVEVEAMVYFPDNRRRDIDNVLKGLLDGMNGVVYEDDSQVQRIIISKQVDRQSPRVEVQVRSLRSLSNKEDSE